MKKKTIYVALIALVILIAVPICGQTLAQYAQRITVGGFQIGVAGTTPYSFAVLDDQNVLHIFNRPLAHTPETGTTATLQSGENDSVSGVVYKLPTGDPEGNKAVEGTSWTVCASTVKKVVLEDDINPTSMNSWFDGFSECVLIDLTRLSTENCTDMSAAFRNCTKLNSIFVGSDWDVSSVASSDHMFLGCTVGSHSTVQATALMGGYGTYFDGSSTDKTLAVIDGNDTPGLLTDGEKDRGYAVYSSETDSMSFFRNTDKLIPGDTVVAGGKTHIVSEVFEGIENISYSVFEMLLPEWTIEVFGFISSGGGGNARVVDITDVYVVDELFPISLDGWFAGFMNIQMIDLKNVRLDNTVSLNNVFELTTSLTTLHMPAALGPGIDSLNSMFDQNSMEYMETPSQLSEITGIEKWDIKNVLDIGSMFKNCVSLKTLDLSGWVFKPEGTGTFDKVFYGCASLTDLKMYTMHIDKGWTSPAMEDVFYGCASLTSLDLTDIIHENSHPLTFSNCFTDMTALQTLILPAYAISCVPDAPLPPFANADKTWYDDAGNLYTGKEVLTHERAEITTYYLGSPITPETAGMDGITALLISGNYAEGYTIQLSGGTLPYDVAVTCNNTAIAVSYDKATGILTLPADSCAKGDKVSIAAQQEPPQIISTTSDVTIASAVKNDDGSYTVTTSGVRYWSAVISSSDSSIHSHSTSVDSDGQFTIPARMIKSGTTISVFFTNEPTATEELIPEINNSSCDKFTTYSTEDLETMPEELQAVIQEGWDYLPDAVQEDESVMYFFYADVCEECGEAIVIFYVDNDDTVNRFIQYIDGEWIGLDFTDNEDGTYTVNSLVDGPVAMLVLNTMA